jgi:transcription initiation factor TFIID subunit 1, fungi type
MYVFVFLRSSMVGRRRFIVESVYPKKRDIPKNFLDGVVGDTKRQVENERVEEVVSSGSIDHDLRVALEVCLLCSKASPY